MGMSDSILSEVYYENGFSDGACAPMYVAIGPLNLIKTMSHDFEALCNEIEQSTLNGSIIDVYEFIPNTWNKSTFMRAYDWSMEERRYIERLPLKN